MAELSPLRLASAWSLSLRVSRKNRGKDGPPALSFQIVSFFRAVY